MRPRTRKIRPDRTRLAARRQAGILRHPPVKSIPSAGKEIVMQFVEAYGARIPQIGLGTMTLKGDICVQAVKTALDLGYRHLDTAEFYGNEKENGEGLRASGIKREEVFICTKVRQGDLMPDNFARVVDQSLANLK